MLLSEDDAKKVAKMMENQISGLSRERKQAARQERADQERAQVRTSTLEEFKAVFRIRDILVWIRIHPDPRIHASD
jgi:hypothetical protein